MNELKRISTQTQSVPEKDFIHHTTPLTPEKCLPDDYHNSLNFSKKGDGSIKSLSMVSMEADLSPALDEFFGSLDNQPSPIDQSTPIKTEKPIELIIDTKQILTTEKVEYECPIDKGQKPGTIIFDSKETLATEGVENECIINKEEKPVTIFTDSKGTLTTEPAEFEALGNKEENPEPLVIEPKEYLVQEVVENECLKIIKAKLVKYKHYNPESRIFQEDLEHLNALELKNGYYIGECERNFQRCGYGTFFSLKNLKLIDKTIKVSCFSVAEVYMMVYGKTI